MLDDIVEWSNLIGLKVSAEKTKFMIMNHPTQISLSANLTQLERVECFTYLGSTLCTDGSSDLDIQQRIHKAQFTFTSLRKPLWNRREISIPTKSRIHTAMVRTILLYGCETWSLKLQHERALTAFEHGCLRQILRIHRQDGISSSNIHQLCKIRRDVTPTVKKHRLE